MKKIVVFLLFITFSASAQKFAWAKDFVGTTDNLYGPEKIIVDKDKNIYVAGRFNGTLDFNPSSTATFTVSSVFPAGSAAREPYLCKLDSNGNFLWVRNWPVNNVVNYGSILFENLNVDNLGNIYILGTFNKIQDFNPSASQTYTLNASSRGSFILKLNSFGNFLWTSHITDVGNSTTSGGYLSDICIDNNNDILFARSGLGGFYYNLGASSTVIPSTRSFPVFLFKINSAGQLQYFKEYGKNNSYALGGANVLKLRINSDNSSNVFVTGEYETGNGAPNQIDFNGDFAITGSNSIKAGFFIKYNSLGNYQYAYKTTSGNLYTNILANNDVYLLSESPGGFVYVSLSNVASPLVPAGTNQNVNIFTLNKINNATGSLTYSKNLLAGPPFGNAQNAVPKVKFDTQGNIYLSVFGVGGQGNSGLSNLTQTTNSVTLYSNPYHVLSPSSLVKLDVNGEFLLSTNGFTNGADFCVDNSQNVYFTGICSFFNNSPDLSPDGLFNTTNNNGFVSKLAFCEAPNVILSGPSQPFCLNQQSFDYIKLSASGGPGIQYWSFQAGITWLNTLPNTTYTRRDSSKVYSAGVYSVAVNNACGYASKDTDNVRVQVYPFIDANANTSFTASCLGGSNGAFSLHPGGGTMPYNFNLGNIPVNSITTNSSSVNAIKISAGTYTFQVTDQNGCYHISSVTIPTVQALQISVTTTATCIGNDGKIKLSSTLIDTAYTYQWSVPGQTSSALNNLNIGAYSFTVTDTDPMSPFANCKYIGSATINPPVNTTVTANWNTTCNTPVNISGYSDAPIQYQWSPAAGVSSPTSLNTTIQATQNQQYTLTTIDGGCIKTYSVNIQVSYPSNFSYTTNSLSVTFSMSNYTYCAGNYLWDYGNGMQSTIAPNPSITYSSPGLYTACLKCGNVPQACIACTTFSLPSNTNGGTDVGIIEIGEPSASVRIYPIPSDGVLFIETEKECRVDVINVFGQTVLSQKLIQGKNTINLADYANGIYYLKGNSFYSKIMKQ